MLRVDVRTSSTTASGLRLVLLAILFVMALTADTRTASAATGGAGQGAAAPARRHRPSTATACGSGTSTAPRAAASRGSSPAPSASDIGTLYIKSGDGGDTWSQFNQRLVDAPAPRRARRLRLAVRLRRPARSARPRSAPPSVRRGADCLVIDAEGHYEGKYAAADRYIRALRARIGAAFPLSLAAFPYVDYHPSFPYSVFLGPGGATYNQPQMYWRAIGTSVRAVYEHTYLFNRRLGRARSTRSGRPTAAPGRKEIRCFRRFAAQLRRPGRRAGGTGRRRATAAGRRSAPASTARSSATGRSPRTPAAEARQPRRPRRLGPAAPAHRRSSQLPVTGHLRQADPLRGPRLPGRPGLPGRRRDRHRNLALAA